jgi:hypothetical protein
MTAIQLKRVLINIKLRAMKMPISGSTNCINRSHKST